MRTELLGVLVSMVFPNLQIPLNPNRTLIYLHEFENDPLLFRNRIMHIFYFQKLKTNSKKNLYLKTKISR